MRSIIRRAMKNCLFCPNPADSLEHVLPQWLYRLTLLADCVSTLLPTCQYDWQEIFDYLWRMPRFRADPSWCLRTET